MRFKSAVTELAARRRDARHSLPVRQTVRHFAVTGTHVWAVYRVTPLPWSFRSADEQARTSLTLADRWAKLAGHWVQERVISQPFPASAWARQLDARTPTPLPDVHTCNRVVHPSYVQQLVEGRLSEDDYFRRGLCGCETYESGLIRQQKRMLLGGMSDRVVFRSVSVAQLPRAVNFRAELLSAEPSDEVRHVLDSEAKIAEIMAGPGFSAQRASAREVEWMLRRSVAPLLPSGTLNPLREDEGYAEADMHLFTDDVTHEAAPFDRTVRVTAFRDGVQHTAHVAALTLGRLEGFTYPENGLEPWTAFADRALSDGESFPVEWVNTFEVFEPERLVKRVEKDLKTAQNNLMAYAEVGAKAPPVARRLPSHAERVYDEVADGAPAVAVRVDGPFRMLVAGSTPDETLRRVRALQELYRRKEMQMELQHPRGQVALVREAVVGAQLLPGHRKQMSLQDLSYGNPAVVQTIGDRRGPYIGYTSSGARRPFLHDSFYATESGEGRRPNLHGICGVPGSGKSVLQDMLVYTNARRGIRSLKNDPSGMSGRLCEMPELKPHSLRFDIIKDGEPGILNPPGLVMDPTLEEYAGNVGRHASALLRTEQERRALARDIAQKLMPEADLFHRAAAPLREASQSVRWTKERSLWDLVDALRERRSDEWTEVANALEDAASYPKLGLLFPPRGEATDRYTLPSKTLTVISTLGLHLPDEGLAREDWSPDEHAAVPLTSLSVFFTGRAAYDKPMDERAALFMDEVHEPLKTSAGRSLYNRLARDSSKWNLAIYASSQAPDDILQGDVADYLASVFVARLKTPAVCRQALDLLQVEDSAHVQTIQSLSAGEFIHSDVDGNVQRIRADIGYYPRLKEYVFTDPRPAGSAAWEEEEVLT